MTRSFGTKAGALIAAGALATGLAACGDSSSSSTKKAASKPSTGAQSRTIVSGVSVYTPDPAAQAALKKAGVTLTPSGTGVKASATAFEIPATGGRIVVKSLVGSVHSGSSLTFAKGAQKVTFTDIALNTESRKVTGNYKGKRIAVFQLRLNNLSAAKNKQGALVGSKIGVVYARGAVALVNKTLGVSVLKTKQTYGTVTFTVVARKSTGSTSKKSKKKSSSSKSTASKSTTATTTKKQ